MSLPLFDDATVLSYDTAVFDSMVRTSVKGKPVYDTSILAEEKASADKLDEATVRVIAGGVHCRAHSKRHRRPHNSALSGQVFFGLPDTFNQSARCRRSAFPG